MTVISWIKKKWWWIKKKWCFNAFFNFLLVVATGLGVIIVRKELIQLTEQNEVLELTSKQTYRPLGIIEKKGYYYNFVHPDSFDICPDKKEESEKYSYFGCRKRFYNRGNGLLLLIGWFTFSSEKEINFGSKSLIDNIEQDNVDITKKVLFDIRHQEARLKELFPAQTDSVSIIYELTPDKTEYYNYTAFFYKDQNNNLYDTVDLEYWRFIKPVSFSDSVLTPKIDIHNNFFHSYDTTEHNKLYKIILPIHPHFAEFIGKK